MRHWLLLAAVLTLGLMQTGCIVQRPARCYGGRVFRGGMCVCPSPYAWSGVRRRCVRPRVVHPGGAYGYRRGCGGGQVYVGGRCVCRSGSRWSPASRRCVGVGVYRTRPGVVVRPRVRGPGVRPVVRPRVIVRPGRRARCGAGMVFRGGRCVCPSPRVWSPQAGRCVVRRRVPNVRVRPGY